MTRRDSSAVAVAVAAILMAAPESTAQTGVPNGDVQAAGIFETPMGLAFNHIGAGANFIEGSETTRFAGLGGAAGQGCPFELTDKALPPLPAGAIPVHTFIAWNYLANDTPGSDTIEVNGVTITGTLRGSGSEDLCWGKDFGVAYVFDTPGLGPVAPGGINLIGGAGGSPCDGALGSDANALGEGITLLVVYDVPASPPRNVDVYWGYVSTRSGPLTNDTVNTLAFSNVFNSGDLHFFLNALDGQVANDNFFIDGVNVGGVLPQTGAANDAWQGFLWGGASATNNLYDRADGDIAPFVLAPAASVTFETDGFGDCIGHSLAAVSFRIDCNGNGIPDDEDIANGTSQDCNGNGVPDECDIANGTSQDCNGNSVPDECDIANGTSLDCNGNGVPDECDIANGTSPDCNGNGVPDECDIASDTSADLDGNGIPDECEGDADFEDPQEVEAAGNPNIVAIGDLDGDGTTDVVTAIPDQDPQVNGVVQVFLNQGTDMAGQFLGLLPNLPVTVGLEPSGVAVGLFDADLHVDVAVTNAGDNTLLILYNKGLGDGSLFDPVEIVVGNRPSAVVAADFNLDTFVDLAVTNQLDSNAMLILNADFPPPDGGGGAAAPAGFATFPIGGEGFALISDDFDGNKRPDMAGTGRATGLAGPTGLVFVLLGLGDGTFEEVAVHGIGLDPLDLASADLQRDGAVDIAAVNTGDGTVSILINQLDGTFVVASTLAVGSTPVSIDAVELSGDSDPDLAVVAIDSEIGPAIQVLQNALGLGNELVFEDPIPFSVDADPNFVVSADLNDDGAADLVTVNADEGETGGSVTALLGNPSPIAFPTQLDIRPGGCPNPLNRMENGFLPVALVGTADFDVSQVDLTTVVLERAAGIGSSVAPHEGPPGPSSVIEDVATPFDGELCNCHDLDGDGTLDLSVKFPVSDVVTQLRLDLLEGGDEVELVLSGLLLDETPFAASDCIKIVPPPDIDLDGVVGVADLLMLLGAWGPCTPAEACLADLDVDGTVSVSDLLILLANWG